MKKSAFQIILLFYSGIGLAQQPVSNSGNLRIHNGGSLTSFGNFTNGSAGVLVNNGTLNVKGDLSNNEASMSVGTGTLYLSGSIAQALNGSAPFRTFNLVTNNSAPGGITLNNNLAVSGAHSFLDGIITTSVTPNYLVYEAGSSYSGDGDGQHVNGWVKKLGNTDFSFPVGNGTVIRKAAIESLSGSLEFDALYLPITPNPTNMNSPLVLVDPNEYWLINMVNGSGSAQIHLNWDNSKVAFSQYVLNSIRVAHQDAGVWTDRGGSATGDINTIGDVTSGTVSAFGNFTFGSTQFLIPLQFLGITAQRKVGYNLVEWKTADAFNTDHFEIERSEDGLHFQKIGTMPSINANSVLTYTFRDINLTGGTLWYRIRSVDVDGKFKLSSVVMVREQPVGSGMMYVLNNPARGSIRLYAPESYKGSCDYYLRNASGQLIQKGTFMVTGVGNISIKMEAGIEPGTYILQVKKDKQQFQERILVQ